MPIPMPCSTFRLELYKWSRCSICTFIYAIFGMKDMNVICLEEEAFYELVKQVVNKLKNTKADVEPEWIDGEEAMKLLKCKKTKLQGLRNSGEIEYSQPSRKIVVYYRPSIIAYLEKHLKETF